MCRPHSTALRHCSSRRASAVNRACTDAVEAAVLSRRVGELFDAVVVDAREKGRSRVQVLDPPVLAPVIGDVALGAALRVRLVQADVGSRVVESVPA